MRSHLLFILTESCLCCPSHLFLLRCERSLSAWVPRYHTPRNSNKQLLLWKISSADNQGLPFVDLRKKLNSLNSRFRQLSCRYVKQCMMKLNCGLSVWQNSKDFYSQVVSFLWIGHTHTHTQNLSKQLIKPLPYWTFPNRTRINPLFEIGQCISTELNRHSGHFFTRTLQYMTPAHK